jgi:hypothetical protein
VAAPARVGPGFARRSVGAAALALATLAGACHEPAPVGAGGAVDFAVAEAAPQFVDVDFATLYPIFLRHQIAQGPKAALWAQRYHRRWVRWTGRIRSFTPNGITLKQLAITTTFDVSLWINNRERDDVRARYRVGDEVTYVGRLDSYDDIWRTLYLVNGSVLTNSSADLGF